MRRLQVFELLRVRSPGRRFSVVSPQGKDASGDTHAQGGEVLGVLDEVLHLARHVEHAQARLERVDRLVDVLPDPARIEQGLLLLAATGISGSALCHARG